jgi:DNA modification methylase
MAIRPSSLVDTRIIYCGDCIDQLRKLPNECVDLGFAYKSPLAHKVIGLPRKVTIERLHRPENDETRNATACP